MLSWYCVHVKPKQEDLVCRRLAGLPGLEMFSPKMVRRKHTRSKPQIVTEELFPSYIFAQLGDFGYLHTIRYTRGVRRLVGDHTGMAWTVDRAIIDAIRASMVDGYVQLCPTKLSAGDQVLITDGPFAGLTAVLLRDIHPRERVLVMLRTIQSCLRVEVDRELVTKI